MKEYNRKIAIVGGVVTYIISFIVGISTAMITGITPQPGAEIPAEIWYSGAVSSVIIMVFSTTWYFKKVKPTAKAGALFGLTCVGVGFAIDLILLTPMAMGEMGAEAFTYYHEPLFWLTILLVIITPAIVGYTRDQ